MKIKNLSKTNFLSVIRNWKIVNQILFAQLIITCLIFLFLLAATLISQRIFEQLLQNSSNEIFIKETKWSLNTLGIYKDNFQDVLKSAEMQIKLINQLYFSVQKYKNFSTKEPLQCLNKPNTNDSYSYSSSSCYGLFGTVTESNLQELKPSLDVTSLLTAFRVSIDYTQALYFSQKNDAQFYTINQGFYFPQGFQPHKRPWYQFHVSQTSDDHQVVYGNPYKVLISGVKVPQTIDLINLQRKFDGVVAKDVNFGESEIFKTIDQSSTLMLIKKDGTVVYHKLYNNQSQPIFNVSEEINTGFNQTDFEQIIAFHFSRPFTSNCLESMEDFLCRYNSIAKQGQIILTANITGSPYILLLLKDPTLLIKQNDEQMIMIQKEINRLNDNIVLMFSVAAFLVIVFSYAFVNVILQQLKVLIRYTNFQMIGQMGFKKNLMFNIKKEKWFHTKTVTNLCNSIIQLMRNQKTKGKNLECQLEELKKYPSREPCSFVVLPEAIKNHRRKISLQSLISLIKHNGD